MKKYKIAFTDDYLYYEERAKEGDKYWRRKVEENPKELERCRKWSGKELTIVELEIYIEEFGRVVFNGETIEVYNGQRE